MAFNDPPKYRYPLYDKWDREAFELIKKVAKKGNPPIITGSSSQINRFLITLIRTQKALHDWRDILKDTLQQIIDDNIIDVALLNRNYPPDNISKEKPGWVVYKEDETVNDFIDKLKDKDINFQGTNGEKAEFILRFILSQLGNDWKLAILMIWEMLGDEKGIEVKDLNNEMKNFDYSGLFN